MAKLNSSSILTLFLFLFLLLSNEMLVTGRKVCQRRSKTWSGACANSGNCDRQCKNWAGALHGACHFQFPGVACFCYFRC